MVTDLPTLLLSLSLSSKMEGVTSNKFIYKTFIRHLQTMLQNGAETWTLRSVDQKHLESF
jgi:hypothetical protein